MKELNKVEVQDVNGGAVVVIAVVTVAIVVYFYTMATMSED